MPPLLTMSRDTTVVRWWEGYVSTYLERDLRQLSQVESPADFRRVMIAAVLRSGQRGRLQYHPAPPDRYRPDGWWKRETDPVHVFSEYIKRVMYWVKY